MIKPTRSCFRDAACDRSAVSGRAGCSKRFDTQVIQLEVGICRGSNPTIAVEGCVGEQGSQAQSFDRVFGKDAIRTIAADPVSNRHATVHGYVSYAAPHSSFNAMAGAEYLFMAIPALKAAAEEDASHIDTDQQ